MKKFAVLCMAVLLLCWWKPEILWLCAQFLQDALRLVVLGK